MSNTKGRISELTAVRALLDANYQVAEPTVQYGFDLVIRKGNWYTVQVKTAWRSGANSVRVSLQRKRKYGPNAFDYLCAVYEQHVWLIPWYLVADNYTVVLSLSLDGGKWAPYKV